MTLEEEIRSLHALLPESMSQLPPLFAESVSKSCASVLGEGPGEALVRRIGEENLLVPDRAFGRVDAFLSGGSDMLKEAIRQGFRERVHRLYRMAMNIEGRRFASDREDDTSDGSRAKLRVSSSIKMNPRSR